MSLYKRIKEKAFEDLLAASHEKEQERLQEGQNEARRVGLVRTQLEMVAANLEVSLRPLVAVTSQSRYYFLLGDLVIMVQSFNAGGQKPNPSLPKQLAFEYCAYLVGVEPRGRIVHQKIGMLKLLNFSGIAKTLNHAPADYNFDADEVERYLAKAS